MHSRLLVPRPNAELYARGSLNTRPSQQPVLPNDKSPGYFTIITRVHKGQWFPFSDLNQPPAETGRPRDRPTRGRYHGGRRPSSDDSPTTIPPSALDKPSIMKRYHRRRTCSHTSPRRLPTMVTLHDTRFGECRWWNDCENCRHLTVVGLHDTGPRSHHLHH